MTEPNLQLLLQLVRDLQTNAQNERGLCATQWQTCPNPVGDAHHTLSIRYESQHQALSALLRERDDLAARVIAHNTP